MKVRYLGCKEMGRTPSATTPAVATELEDSAHQFDIMFPGRLQLA